MIAFCPCFYRGKHTHHFFTAYFVITARTMVRRTGLPCRHQYIFSAKNEPGTLRPANSFATTIYHNIGSILQVYVWNSKHFCCCVYENRNLMWLCNFSDVLCREWLTGL